MMIRSEEAKMVAALNLLGDKMRDRFHGLDDEISALQKEVRALKSDLDAERRLRLCMKKPRA